VADLIGALERRGLVRREVDSGNRRKLLITRTEEGRQFLAEYAPVIAELEARMPRDLDPRAQATSRAALDSCRRALGTPQRDPQAPA
jgi:DNA-binding MarR family transcriptional regulator